MLKNYFFLFVFVLVSGSLFGQDAPRKPPKNVAATFNKKAGVFIDVNAASYAPSSLSPEQLVKDILINGGSTCSVPNISNVSVSPNHAVTNTDRFWGYFHKGTTNFPFTDGIILSTGKAKDGGNTSVFASTTIGTGSDPDLIAAINPTVSMQDAVVLEFDFVPNSNQVKFNYIFASEEYTSNYPCSYSDGFALLLRPAAGGPYVNMAILPNNAGPVAMTNIHPEITGFGGCQPINENYFAGYNSTPNVETNYEGRTVPLTAVADVVPGQPYHFKMVLADAKDPSYDTAVFLEGGSFDIGIKIVDSNGVVLPNELKMCDNTPMPMVAQVSPLPGMTFQWYKDGAAINGATGGTYVATQPGVYEVKVMVPGNNCPASATITILGGTTPTAQNANLKLCSTPTNNTFNLNTAKPLISTTTGAVFRFYPTQGGAQAQDNTFIPEANLAAYNGTDGQILYVLVSNGAFCSKVVTLTLNKEDLPTAQLNASRLKICVGESVTLTASGGATYQWGDTSTTAAVRNLSPTQTTTYTVYAIGAQGCKSPTAATITIEVVPAITSDLKGGMICEGDQITLDAGTGPNHTYTWNTGDTSQTITVSTPGAYTVTVTNGVCTKSYTTQVIRAIIPEIIKVDYKESGVLTITASNPSNGPLEYSIDNGVTWQNSNTFAGVPRNKVIAIRVRVKNTSCVGFLEYFTFVMQNVITPNGDNVNDMIDFRGISEYKDFKGFVFDRYGKTVFTASKMTPYWDGYFQGKRLPTATYWYQVTFEDPASKQLTVKTGWILLKNIE